MKRPKSNRPVPATVERGRPLDPLRPRPARPHRLLPHLRRLGPRAAVAYCTLETFVTVLLAAFTLLVTGAVGRGTARPRALSKPLARPGIARPIFVALSLGATWVAFYGLLSWSLFLFLEAAIIAGIFMRAAYVPTVSGFVSSHLGRAARPLITVLVMLTVTAGSLAALGSHELEKTSHVPVDLVPANDGIAVPVRLQADGQPPIELVLTTARHILVPAAFEKTTHTVMVIVDGGGSMTFQVPVNQALQLRISPTDAPASQLTVTPA